MSLNKIEQAGDIGGSKDQKLKAKVKELVGNAFPKEGITNFGSKTMDNLRELRDMIADDQDIKK